MKYESSSFENAVAALRRASFSLDQSFDHAMSEGETDVVRGLARNVYWGTSSGSPSMWIDGVEYNPDQDEPFSFTTPADWQEIQYTTSGGLFWAISRPDDVDGRWKAFINVGEDHTSTLMASAFIAGFSFEDHENKPEGYNWNEATKRIAAGKAAAAFGLDRGAVYDLLTAQEEMERKTAPPPVYAYEDEDEDDFDLGESTLAKLRGTTVMQAAIEKGVTTQAIYDILRDDARRAEIFPKAKRFSTSWILDAGDVEAWEPRNYPRN